MTDMTEAEYTARTETLAEAMILLVEMKGSVEYVHSAGAYSVACPWPAGFHDWPAAKRRSWITKNLVRRAEPTPDDLARAIVETHKAWSKTERGAK